MAETKIINESPKPRSDEFMPLGDTAKRTFMGSVERYLRDLLCSRYGHQIQTGHSTVTPPGDDWPHWSSYCNQCWRHGYQKYDMVISDETVDKFLASC